MFDQLMVPDDEGSIMGSPMTFMPAAEMHETPDEIKLRIEVPGIESSDLDVNVSTEAL
jgi:HSP20 family protein